MPRSARQVAAIASRRNIRSQHNAATWIQKHWRGSRIRFFAPRKEQMGPQVFGHTSLTGDTEYLNIYHQFWRSRSSDNPVKKQSISFSDKCLVREGYTGDKFGDTDFRITRDKSSRLFANTIVSLFENSGKKLSEFFSHPSAGHLKPYFEDTISKLDQGKKVTLWDGKSTTLKPTNMAVSAVKECFVKYTFFTKPVESVEPVFPRTSCYEENIRIQNEMELMVNNLLGAPITCTVKPLPSAEPNKPNEPKKPNEPNKPNEPLRCFEMISQEPYNVDDLEERLQKLMNLPNSK